jgi:hypothetical protein
MLPSCHGLRAWAVVSKVNWSIGLPFFDSRARITYEEFEAFENYVLNHTIGDDNYSYDDDSQTDRLDYNPIGAFYD